MIFAAGLGTRLKPLTNDIPKALIKVKDRPLLEWIIRRLKSFGIDQIIINIHHHADMIVDFLKTSQNFGLHIELSYEEILADTGGGLKKAAWFFDDADHFLVHNVDILSDIDLRDMYTRHLENNAAATLAIRKRPTSRYLLFNRELQLCGWRSKKENETIWVNKKIADAIEFSFCGIHIITSKLLKQLKNENVFSIIPEYLRLAAGNMIRGYRTESDNWIDLGRKENFESIDRIFKGSYFQALKKVS